MDGGEGPCEGVHELAEVFPAFQRDVLLSRLPVVVLTVSGRVVPKLVRQLKAYEAIVSYTFNPIYIYHRQVSLL